ncbi:hypothetical protein Q7P37_001358 [Cladosporium fusiforme]
MSFFSASPVHPPAHQLSIKKRKRDETSTPTHPRAPTEIDARPFAIRPTGNDPFARTITFTPVCVLLRTQLPLAFLAAENSGSRLFTTHIQALESFHENGEEGRILLAEQKEEGRLYVVERAAKRVYALCRLGAWVTKNAVSRMAKADTGESERTVKRRAIECTNASPWWAQAAVDIPKDVSRARTGLLRLSTRPHLPNGTSEASAKYADSQATAYLEAQPAGNAVQEERRNTEIVEAAPQDPLEELAKQYLDALYLSRTSLAYFAKGPLSRARSTFTIANDTSTSLTVLVEFLRNAILPATTMDKKYKDSIATTIKELPVVTPSPLKSRRKKKFKPKRDKAGMFSNEQEYLEKWWRGEELPGSMVSPENMDTRLRRRIPDLRTRETYLQIIIILETLFLETATTNTAQQHASDAPKLDPETQNVESQDVESQTVSNATKRKGKKALDLHMLLETLLDRLCIWQSLEAHTPAKSLHNDGDAKNNESDNELRNFCVEIIVPFFTPRLPKEAALVNKKLGGPSPPSPEKRKSTSSRSKPGEPAIRSRPETKPRKPLSRVATETLNHTSNQIPSLHRSATDPVSIKREDSQPALASIPPALPPPRKPRESLLKSYSSGHRQVDLNASSAAAAEKLRKKRETEAQVREAIANARKPNRPNATKEVAARADERFAQTLAKSSSRSSRPQGVHVAATPKRPKSAFTTQYISASHHSSQPLVIPSSSARYRAAPPPLSRVDSTPAVPQTSHRNTASTRVVGVEETPSRESSLKFAPISPSALRAAPLSLRPTSLCDSPTARRTTSHVAATPVKGVTRKVSFGLGHAPSMPSLRDVSYHAYAPATSAACVQGTPIKPAAASGGLYREEDSGGGAAAASGGAAAAADIGVGVGSEIAGKSIYDAWDDDDYEELA